MSGAGLGFSCETKHTSKLPDVADEFFHTDTTIVVRDSRTGWAKAYKELISMLYSGQLPTIDYSLLRPAGAKLKVMGGRSSGPEPLRDLFEFTKETFKKAVGRKLAPIEVHDIMCKVGEIVVVGGVRRSALISLSDLHDDNLRYAKHGAWWENTPHRALANNSAVHYTRPDSETFLREWTALVESKSGERGISGLGGSRKMAPERRDGDKIEGYNPCHEVALRSCQMCNLSEIVARENDTAEDLKRKAKVAAILGTLQSTLTDFKYLRKKWKDNCEEERLLGVSITGIMDCRLLNGKDNTIGNNIASLLEELRDGVTRTNRKWAKRLGVNASTATTVIKPSGTVSQLTDAASGIHGRYSPRYVRTVRQDKKDPLSTYLVDQGVPVEDDVMNPDKTYVFSFPIASPDSAVMASDQSAIEQLENWLLFKKHWTEHSPSVTVYVKDEEWMEVGAWVYRNFDHISGISFLPYSDHTYQQAPYQPISQEAYDEALLAFPQDIDWSLLSSYEKEDNTEGAKTLACTGGVCEL